MLSDHYPLQSSVHTHCFPSLSFSFSHIMVHLNRESETSNQWVGLVYFPFFQGVVAWEVSLGHWSRHELVQLRHQLKLM